MKMHKKLFGLLATAVVGLTLTSCGGGGGGGGGEGGGENVGEEIIDSITGSVNSTAPASLVGKKFVVNLSGGSRTEEYVFLSPSSVENTFTDGDGDEGTLSGNYTYTRKEGGEAYLNIKLRNYANANYDLEVVLDFSDADSHNGRVEIVEATGYAQFWSSVYMR